MNWRTVVVSMLFIIWSTLNLFAPDHKEISNNDLWANILLVAFFILERIDTIEKKFNK